MPDFETIIRRGWITSSQLSNARHSPRSGWHQSVSCSAGGIATRNTSALSSLESEMNRLCIALPASVRRFRGVFRDKENLTWEWIVSGRHIFTRASFVPGGGQVAYHPTSCSWALASDKRPNQSLHATCEKHTQEGRRSASSITSALTARVCGPSTIPQLPWAPKRWRRRHQPIADMARRAKEDQLILERQRRGLSVSVGQRPTMRHATIQRCRRDSCLCRSTIIFQLSTGRASARPLTPGGKTHRKIRFQVSSVRLTFDRREHRCRS